MRKTSQVTNTQQFVFIPLAHANITYVHSTRRANTNLIFQTFYGAVEHQQQQYATVRREKRTLLSHN